MAIAELKLPDRAFPKTIGPYEVVCELGRGAMAVVYLARTQNEDGSSQLFAIKLMHSHLSFEEKFVDLFLSEGRITERIRQTNVIPVHKVGVHEDDRHYMVMDYVSGETLALALAETWDRDRPFPYAIASEIIAASAHGLQAAHVLTGPDGESLGVIHRDVNPKNILIGYDGVPRVMDFGVAKALDRAMVTRVGVWRGTAPYLAPEQIIGEEMDRRIDIFAMGIVLWETTTGRRLFKHDNEMGTLGRVLRMKIPEPLEVRKDCPQELNDIIMRALSREPDERQQTAKELADGLRNFLANIGEPITSSEVRGFMKDVFPGRREERIKMEQDAITRHDPSHVDDLKDMRTEVLAVVDAPGQEPIEDEDFAQWLSNASGEGFTPEMRKAALAQTAGLGEATVSAHYTDSTVIMGVDNPETEIADLPPPPPAKPRQIVEVYRGRTDDEGDVDDDVEARAEDVTDAKQPVVTDVDSVETRTKEARAVKDWSAVKSLAGIHLPTTRRGRFRILIFVAAILIAAFGVAMVISGSREEATARPTIEKKAKKKITPKRARRRRAKPRTRRKKKTVRKKSRRRSNPKKKKKKRSR